MLYDFFNLLLSSKFRACHFSIKKISFDYFLIYIVLKSADEQFIINLAYGFQVFPILFLVEQFLNDSLFLK